MYILPSPGIELEHPRLNYAALTTRQQICGKAGYPTRVNTC